MVSSVTCKQWVYIIGNLAWFKRSRIRLLCFRFWILRHVHETHVIRSVTFKHEVCVAVGQLLRLRRSGCRLPSRLFDWMKCTRVAKHAKYARVGRFAK